MVGEEVPQGAADGTADEDSHVRRLAESAPGETSWQAIARKRELISVLEAQVKRDTPVAVSEAKAAGVKVAELADQWDVTAAWIYTVAPARTKRTKN